VKDCGGTFGGALPYAGFVNLNWPLSMA